MPIHLSRTSQIQGLDEPILTALQWDKALTKILAKYSDYANVFFSDLAIEVLENTRMNEYAIKLIDGKQSSYGPIYALNLVELETLKTYIETYLKTRFIQLFKSPTSTFILFDKKLDSSLCLYVNYWGLNNLTIKNQYLLPLIGEFLDQLSQAKRFTQLDLTNAYHQIKIWEDDK